MCEAAITISLKQRPGHLTPTIRRSVKYGDALDLRGGGSFSARMTAPLCFAGALCMQLLKKRGVTIGAHLYSIGEVHDAPFDAVGADRKHAARPGPSRVPSARLCGGRDDAEADTRGFGAG